MKAKQLIAIFMFLLCANMMYAQDITTVRGRVTGPDGNPLPGVTVSEKKTGTATSTNADGVFNIKTAKGAVLVFTSVGYESKEITVKGGEELLVTLSTSNTELTTVVVTALGIKKQKKSLGYSVTEVAGNSLTQARETNVMNSLAGKVAGLNITAGSGGPGASNNVLIRGLSSIGGAVQPLYVVNGIPMENERGYQAATQWDNGPDKGDAISNLNPDDIESISVLKGAAASALYGYRAKAGVIMITTKSGKGSGIEFNSNLTAEKVMNMTDWQYIYGQGTNNRKPNNATEAGQAGNSSWGGKMDGTQVVQFDDVSRPYSPVKNNVEKFYRTGLNWTNTVTLNKSFTGGAIRFSASNMNNQSVVPNSKLERNTFNFSGNFDPIQNLKVDVKANYILENAKNRAMLSDGAGNANYQVMFLPTSLDVNTLKPGWNPDGSELAFNKSNPWATNPWFQVKKFMNNTKRDRLLSSLTARYDFVGGYYIQGRVGRDNYRDQYLNVVPTGTAYRPNGSLLMVNTDFTDLNADVLLGKTFAVGDFTISPIIGSAYRSTKNTALTNNGSDFNVPFVYNVLNLKNKGLNFTDLRSEIQSAYANAELSYRELLYVTGSVRSDWFSSLATPGTNNKLNVVYPSINTSFIFSELWKPVFLNYGKLRLGYAEVGQATDPYKTQLSYVFMSETIGGTPLGKIDNNQIPNSGLRPSRAKELELGLEFSILNNLLSADISWYNKKSVDEIIPVTTSISTGYEGAVLNIGSMRNKGAEALITLRPMRNNSGFNWTTSLNGSVNDNKILELAEGTESMSMGVARSGVAFVQHVKGMSAFQIMATDYRYDANGQIERLATGEVAKGDLKPQGSAIPKWTAGWNNEFKYKALNASFLFEGKWGAKIYSGTDYYGYKNGLHKATLVNREGDFAPAGSTNKLEASAYYSSLVDNVSKTNVQSADFIKLRQVVVGYTFPALFNNIVKSLTISAVARNPFILMRRTDNIDPEASFSSYIPGIELGGVPPVRSFGINLNVKF
ncbi:MAG: SusC/RagA family TonB-linked outer membrane protein [Niabella sp.]